MAISDYRHEFDLLDQLRKDGWYIVDMAEHEPNIRDIVKWCNEILGKMLIMYDLDYWVCRWHGGTIEVSDNKLLTIFAFKSEADYTMLKLKFA